MDTEIQITKRDSKTKREAKRLRHGGEIPVVIYSQANSSVCASLKATDFETILRNLKPGYLPTTIFSLKDAKGKKTRAIIKDIQYEVTSYSVIHLDFKELSDEEQLDIKVPVEFLNRVDCIGEKMGGFLRALMRHVKVRCFPKDIPSHFEIDVRDLNLNQLKRVADLAIPARIKLLGRADDIVVTVVKR